MTKLELLKKYIALQAEDEGLWFIAEYATEGYLQHELRKVAYMIEEASENEILRFINDKKEILGLIAEREHDA